MESTIVRRVVVQSCVGDSESDSLRGTDVDQVSRSGDSLSPIARRHRGLKQKSAGDIVHCANCTFCFVILSRGVRAGETKANAVGGEKVCDSSVDEFGPVVSLHSNKRQRELCAGIGDKGD
jgi:hypothetical protein